MQIIPFIADSAADAVAKIRTQLGSDAVVVNVRQLPADGLSRLWRSPKIEVLAYKPEAIAPAEAPVEELSDLRLQIEAIRKQLPGGSSQLYAPTEHAAPGAAPVDGGDPFRAKGAWRVAGLLESAGLLPVTVQRVVDQLRNAHGDLPPETLAEEIVLARGALKELWPRTPATTETAKQPHILIGPAGVGKTTCLCKWLTQARLVEGRDVQVWRLDGTSANAAESLSVYGEILGVPVERTWSSKDAGDGSKLCLIDLPGTDWRNASALRDLGRQLEDFGPCRVHLTLNLAYEVTVLLAQARAFSHLPVESIIFTHLDEERRWGKIWNVVLGTKLPARFLSAAQNIPGEFFEATPERILSRQFSA